MIWEYMRIRKGMGSLHELDQELVPLGLLGWEMCGFAAGEKIGLNEYTVFLKRPRAELPHPREQSPAWQADPSGRFEQRYWDGVRWTEHVSRNGEQLTDLPVL